MGTGIKDNQNAATEYLQNSLQIHSVFVLFNFWLAVTLIVY